MVTALSDVPHAAALAFSACIIARPGACSAALQGTSEMFSLFQATYSRVLGFGRLGGNLTSPLAMMRSDAPPNFWERESAEAPSRLIIIIRSVILKYSPLWRHRLQKMAMNSPLSLGTTVGTPSSNVLHGYLDSGAFQETSESWDRPSVPTGPALGEGRANKPTGGKPDWYRMISDKDNRVAKYGSARSKNDESVYEVPIPPI